jgi:hypothetical protein
MMIALYGEIALSATIWGFIRHRHDGAVIVARVDNDHFSPAVVFNQHCNGIDLDGLTVRQTDEIWVTMESFMQKAEHAEKQTTELRAGFNM